jgi:Uma2 family endonuclease
MKLKLTAAQRNEYGPYGIHPESGVEEELSHNLLHFAEIQYLLSVLKYYYRVHKKMDVGIVSDIPLYLHDPANNRSPDISVIPGITTEPTEPDTSYLYQVGVDGPPPRIVFEVASLTTWDLDLEPDEKPARYAAMGIPYYVAYDPYEPTIWRHEWANKGRLIVWKLNQTTGQYEELPKVNGGVWCDELESTLKVEGPVLRLYDGENNIRPTVDEANEQDKAVMRAEFEIEREGRRQERAGKERERAEKIRIRQEAEAREAELRAENARIQQEAEAREAALQAELEKLRAQLKKQQPNDTN